MRFTNITFFVVFHRIIGHTLAQINLGTAADFGIVASTAITSTGSTIVLGDLALSPNGRNSISGFPPGLAGTVHAGNEVAVQARQDARNAFNAAGSLASDSKIVGANLGGQRLVAGTYTSASSVGLTGTLTLDGQNDPESLFVFQIGSTLTTASSSSVILVNGARACNVFFQVGSSATLGTSTRFNGNILALASISLLDNVDVNGGLYALNGAVSLINDRITPQQSCIIGTTSTTAAGFSSTLLELSTTIPNTITTAIPDTITNAIPDGTTLKIPVDEMSPTLPVASITIPIQAPSTSSTLNNPNVPDTPNTPNLPDIPNIPNIPNIPGVPNVPDTPNTPITPDIPNTPITPSSPDRPRTRMSTKPSESRTTSNTRLTRSTKPLKTTTISTSRSYSTPAPNSFSFSTSDTLTESTTTVYSVYVSTQVKYSGNFTLASTTYSRPEYTQSKVEATSKMYNGTTTINGTPCTTLSYYEPTCACTKTTVVPVVYTPMPEVNTVDLTTINGVPCTSTKYFEDSCNCIRTSNVPIMVVSATVSIATVINGVPCITSKYFEPACDCVQTATIPVRIASVGEVADATAQESCTQTPNVLSSCIMACMQPHTPAATIT